MNSLLAIIGVPVFLIGLFFFFKDYWPMWRQHRRDLKNVYPKAGKPNKKDIRKPEEKTLDFLLMPEDFPTFTRQIVDEHEKAIS